VIDAPLAFDVSRTRIDASDLSSGLFRPILDLNKRKQARGDRTAGKIDAERPGLLRDRRLRHRHQRAGRQQVAWTPTIAKWLRPLSPNAERFWKREQRSSAIRSQVAAPCGRIETTWPLRYIARPARRADRLSARRPRVLRTLCWRNLAFDCRSLLAFQNRRRSATAAAPLRDGRVQATCVDQPR